MTSRAPVAIAIAAVVVAGCSPMPTHAPPPANAPDTGGEKAPDRASSPCPSGMVAMDPTAGYAVYLSENQSVKALERIKDSVSARCIVAVTSPPPGPAPSPAGAPAPCPSGQVPWPGEALYAEYYEGRADGNDRRVQIEDLRTLMQRCIVPIVSDSHAGCPPPPSTHPVLKNGVTYCVPN